MKRSKRYQKIEVLVDKEKLYSVTEAVSLVKKTSTAKFDEAINITINLNVDTKQSDQLIRSTVSLPHGTGKELKILVFAKGEKEKEAKESGADFIGAEELYDKISKGWVNFDIAISTPDLMKDVGKLGKILGPKGLMPSPKSGTVTFDIKKVVKDFKTGKIEYRTDSSGSILLRIGKASMTEKQLLDNIYALVDGVIRGKPGGVKGEYLKTITISSTMGTGIKIDIKEFLKEQKL